MAMTLFDVLYDATADGSKAGEKRLVKSKVFRALEGAVDSYEGQKIDTLSQIDDLTGKLAQGCVNIAVISALVELTMSLKEIDQQETCVRGIRDKLQQEWHE
jgi:hypothetical protein